MATRQTLYLSGSRQVPASQTNLEVSTVKIKRYTVVRAVDVYCSAKTGTVTVDVMKNDTTILTGTVTPTATAMVAGTVDSDKARLVPGDELQLKITTAAASTVDDCGASIDLG